MTCAEQFTIPKPVMRGEYRVKAVREDGTERIILDWFDNLITNVGLNQLGVGPSWKYYCHIGTGTATPAITDTTLSTPVASVALTGGLADNVVNTSLGSPTYGHRSSVDYKFPTSVTGTFTEVGVATSAHTDAGQKLFSKALFVDGGGSPTTITILTNEYLVVTFRVTMYPPLVDVTGSIIVDAVSYAYIIRALDVSTFDSWARSLRSNGGIFKIPAASYTCRASESDIGAITAVDLISGVNASDLITIDYVDSSLESRGKPYWDFADANFATGIRSISFGMPSGGGEGFGKYQIQFNPKLPKNSTIRYDFEVAIGWARYTP